MEHLKIDEILQNPFQPRRRFAEEELGELTKSIKEYGIIEPLIVRINNNDQFELIAGERRLRAAKMAGLTQVPVILKDYDDKKTAQIALIENLQRSDLNAIEEATAYKRLITDFAMTQDELARKVGKSRSHIANFIRLLNLDNEIQNFLITGKLNMGQAKPLLALDDSSVQLNAAKLIIEKELSARKAELLVKKILSNDIDIEKKIKEESKQKVYVNAAKEKLTQVLGTNVNIKQGKKKSYIEIEFYSEDDLERLMEFLLNEKSKYNTMPRKIIDFNI